jgi:hypothetical protein
MYGYFDGYYTDTVGDCDDGYTDDHNGDRNDDDNNHDDDDDNRNDDDDDHTLHKVGSIMMNTMTINSLLVVISYARIVMISC